jgi:RHS repeat-associated protein
VRATGAVTKAYGYDLIGNITSKTGVGTYSYNPSGSSSVRPHAVSGVSGALNATYTYDANGNMTGGAGRTIAYTSFNKPSQITESGRSVSITYDANQNRIQKVTNVSSTVYLGKLYERTTTGTLVEHKHYVYGGDNLVAVYTERNNGTNDTHYLLSDHLNSVNVVTNDAGNLVERLSYDPHGKRRQVNGQDATGPITSGINRGFTRHEHDEEVGLINMKARLYDPVLGRFLSPDSIIQIPYGQGLNRYTYVNNNPLSFSDPSGHLFGGVFKFLKKLIAPVITIGFSAIGMPFVGSAIGSIVGGLVNGRSIGDIAKSFAIGMAGTFAGVLASAPAGELVKAVGIGPTSIASTIVRNAITGGASGATTSALGGQNVLEGMARGALANAVTAGAARIDDANRIIGRAIARGVGSEIRGGSFVDGAIGSLAAETARRVGAATRGRPLTPEERVKLENVHGDKYNYDKMRVIDGDYVPFQNTPMSPDGNIYTGGGGIDPITVAHESMHMRQWENGVDVLGQGIVMHALRIAFGVDPYEVSYNTGRSISSYNIEAQGTIAEQISNCKFDPSNIDY